MDLMKLMQEYMLTPAPSGYESEMAYKMVEHLKPFCDEVKIDHVGNVIGKISGNKGSEMPRLMVFGHMDQLGFIVRRIEPNGYVQVDRLGGIPEKVLPGLQLLIRSEDGKWHKGVFGPKAHHATPAEEKYKVDLVTNLFIDLGAKTDKEVRALGIEVGCPVIYKPSFEQLIGSRVTGTAVDNRGACVALVSIAENLAANRPDCDTYIVGTVWEEFNLRGAMMAARSVKPDMAIMMDVVLAGDTQDLGSRFEDKLGEGACVSLYSFHGRGTLNGTLPHEPMFKLCKKCAAENNIPLQRFASLGIITDAAYLQLEQDGVACLEMGFPARYTHTPIEVCDMDDVQSLSDLVSAMARGVDRDFQLNRY